MSTESTPEELFPKFLMKIGGEYKFLSPGKCREAFKDPDALVEVVGNALEADFSVRKISPEERSSIFEGAKEGGEPP